MGSITVYFIGICTHMRLLESDLPGFTRRVVLVNGRIPKPINGTLVPPHIPTLRIAPADLVVNGQPGKPSPSDAVIGWDLMGAHVDVANGIGELTYDESFECCIPHLSVLTKEMLAPSKEVVLDAHSDQASCYFDTPAGQFSAGYVANGAATAVLKVTTDGDPVLRLRRFRGTDTQEFQLRDGAEIALMNVGIEHEDDANDFLLHYNTAEPVPTDARGPTEIAPCCKVLAPSYIIPPLSVGPGCSNADFP